MWQALFACAHACTAEGVAPLWDLASRLVPAIIPCARCRQHFEIKKDTVLKRATGGMVPRSPTAVFKWLYFLKDEVNKDGRRHALQRVGKRARSAHGEAHGDGEAHHHHHETHSPSLEAVQLRYVMHGGFRGGSRPSTPKGLVDDVALADVLVLVALDSARPERQCEDLFVKACHALADLLPVAPDSELLKALRRVGEGKAFVTMAHNLARAARVERGLAELPLTHYRKVAAL